jgi:hypothetical protein
MPGRQNARRGWTGALLLTTGDLTTGERHRLQAVFAALQPVPARTESVDILGSWPPHHAPRHALTLPTRRVLLDWSIWGCLVVLAVAHVIASV